MSNSARKKATPPAQEDGAHPTHATTPPTAGVGTLNEKPLHAALKAWCAQPGDRFEEKVDGYVIDLVREGLLIEIQTRNVGALRRKLTRLLEHHTVRLVYPMARTKWIVRMDAQGETSRRKSPKHGDIWDVFVELVSLPHLMAHPRFSLDVVFTEEEEARRHHPGRAWRRKGWMTCERRLVRVVDHQRLDGIEAIAALLPEGLPEPFTTADLATGIRHPRWLATKVAFCLRVMGVATVVGKRGNALLYTRSNEGRSNEDTR